MPETCYRCGATENVKHLYGYPICSSCIPKLKLFTSKTVDRYVAEFNAAKTQDPSHPTYAEDVDHHLQELERLYINKRIKLLDIREKLGKSPS